jgi:hypothetical protein
VGPRAGVDVWAKRKPSYRCRDSTPYLPARRLVALPTELSWPAYAFIQKNQATIDRLLMRVDAHAFVLPSVTLLSVFTGQENEAHFLSSTLPTYRFPFI